MTDIDFDELDRAVNSLISGVPKDSTKPVDDENTVTIKESAPVEVAVATPPVQTQPAAPLAAKRTTGRFMDVVHPSSDMRPNTVAKSAPSVAPEHSMMMAPSSTVTAAGAATSDDESNDTQTSQEPSQDTASPKPLSNDYPDPIDFKGYTPTDPELIDMVQKKEAKSEAASQENSHASDTGTEEVDENAPDELSLSSPFLTDAVVEKRPLGAFSSDDATPAFTPPKAEDYSRTDAEQDEDAQVIVSDESTLPEELHSTLLSIEAGEPLPIEEPEVVPAKKKEAKKAAPSISSTASVAPTVVSLTPEPALTGPTAITQQYKEIPSTGDQQSGSIFDTNAYHKPLTHPLKKKSGWLTVVLIVGIVIIVTGVGLGVYAFVLKQKL